jgi:hypothetical protein
MANSKISALTAATTPLVGTETLPIVQGGVTVKTTVANITNGGGYAGSFTTLASTGNTTLGDATTDTVTVNGYMGIGGATPAANIGVYLVNNGTLTTTAQFGLQVDTTGSSASTTSIQAILARAGTAAAAFTVVDLAGIRISDAVKGAGSTITNQYGLRVIDQTQGTNNYGISSAVTSGTGKWNIYASGTADNYINGALGIGSTTLTGFSVRIAKPITGAVTSYGIFSAGTIQSDVTTTASIYESSPSTVAAAFTLTTLRQFRANQSTIGAGSVVTTQYGFLVENTLIGATSNYAFYGNIAAPTSGIATTGTISTISSSTTTVTVNHNAITYTNGQTVTISATANATALVSGATCTILTVGTTDFTLIGAASNTVGVSFTATGAGTGTGTVTLNVQGSGKTVAGAASGSFTYTTTTSQTFAAVTVLTGSVTVSTRYNLYMGGTAPNYLAGGLNVGATTNPGAGNISLTGNVVQGTAAKGFDFSANTPLAGKTSTILNWYEEGTWTPNQGAGLTLVGAFSSTGTYTRIGRQVSISGTVTGATSVAVTAAGVITSNLPFTVVTAGHGDATNVAVNASATVICTSTSVTAAAAIAATATITFSATYFV